MGHGLLVRAENVGMPSRLPKRIFSGRGVNGQRHFSPQAVGSVVEDVAAEFMQQSEFGERRQKPRIGHRRAGQGVEKFVRDEERHILRHAREFHHEIACRHARRRAVHAVNRSRAPRQSFAAHGVGRAVPPAIRLQPIEPPPGDAGNVEFPAFRLRNDGVVDAEEARAAPGRQNLEWRTLLHDGAIRHDAT